MESSISIGLTLPGLQKCFFGFKYGGVNILDFNIIYSNQRKTLYLLV